MDPIWLGIAEFDLSCRDLDLVITLPKIDMDIVSALQKVSSLLQRDRIAKGIQVIANAKVPIIKFTSVHGEYQVPIHLSRC